MQVFREGFQGKEVSLRESRRSGERRSPVFDVNDVELSAGPGQECPGVLVYNMKIVMAADDSGDMRVLLNDGYFSGS